MTWSLLSPWLNGTASDAEKIVKLRHAGFERGVGNHVHDASILHHVVPVGNGLRKAEVLLDQQDGEAFLLEVRNGAPDLLHDDRGQPLRRLVEEQEPRTSPEDAADREHLL